MTIRKNELIRRLVIITGKNRGEFADKTVKELSALYEKTIAKAPRKYLNVPYKDKDIVKLLGARYDGSKKQWYIPLGVDEKHFKDWM